MKLTGREYVSLSALRNDGYRFTICCLTLDQLLNRFIISNILNDLKKDINTRKHITTSIIINHNTNDSIKFKKRDKLNIHYQISLINNILNDTLYDAYDKNLELKDFYNTIVDLFETYAYEMDTEIDNIHIDIVEIEIVKGDKNENQII